MSKMGAYFLENSSNEYDDNDSYDEDSDNYECPLCGAETNYNTFCPECGARVGPDYGRE